MSFSFNFDPPDDQSDKTNESNGLQFYENKSQISASGNDSENEDVYLTREVTDFFDRSFTEKIDSKSMVFGEYCFKVVDTVHLEKRLLEEEDFKARYRISDELIRSISSHNDLISGVYEGGLKLWECGVDMVEFLQSHNLGREVELKDKRVLEIGCGVGLPGLYCIKCRAKRVDFQDYNEEVLRFLTQPNVSMNVAGEEKDTLSCRYFCGDWGSFSQLGKEQDMKYDVILTAETIYNVDNYSKLHDIFSSCLTEEGIIIVSAKMYYFGVGGGVDSFLEYVGSRHEFNAEVVHSIGTGVPRQIIFLRRLGLEQHGTSQPSGPNS